MHSPSSLIVKCTLQVAHARIYHHVPRAQRSSACRFYRFLVAVYYHPICHVMSGASTYSA